MNVIRIYQYKDVGIYLTMTNDQQNQLKMYILLLTIALVTIILFFTTEIMIQIKKENGPINLTFNDYIIAIIFTMVRLIIPLMLFILTMRIIKRPKNDTVVNLDFEKAFTIVLFILFFYLVVEGFSDLFILLITYIF